MHHPFERGGDYCVAMVGGNVDSVLPLIGGKLSQIYQKLVAIPDYNFWIHEKQITPHLCLSQGPNHGPSDVLSVVIACLKKGYGGNKRKKTFVATGVPVMDLNDASNRIYFQFNGRQEDFCGGAILDTAISKSHSGSGLVMGV